MRGKCIMSKKNNSNMVKLLLQVISFWGVSGIGWILDFATFTILCCFIYNLTLNNFISCFVGVTFVFVVAPQRIFAEKKPELLKYKYLLYLLYQIIVIYLVSILLFHINSFLECFDVNCSALLSKVIVTPILMTCNFVVMKFLIEKIGHS